MQNRIVTLLSITMLAMTSYAQLLPKLEGDLRVSTESGPKLVVWERDDIADVCITIVVQFDPSDIARYGVRLPVLMAALWEEAMPRTMALDALGITFLQVRDSILLQLQEQDSVSQPLPKNTKLWLDYRAREQVLTNKLQNQYVSTFPEIVRDPVMVLPNAMLLRYRIPSLAIDNFFFYLRDKATTPIWLSEWEWRRRIQQGFPDEKRVASAMQDLSYPVLPISEPLPSITGSVAEYWATPLQNAEWSVAMVGKLSAAETMSLAALYWSSWELAVPLPPAQQYSNPIEFPLTKEWSKVTLPVANRDVVRAYLIGGIMGTHRENLALLLGATTSAVVPTQSLTPSIPVEERRARWSQRLKSDLDLPETAADRLAIMQLQEGWERWFVVDDHLSAFADTPEQSWVNELLRKAEHDR
ncbi:MAG: hypothetical protein OEM52_05410 [bacterium]|nr:hypothetical protein [bacterium]